MLNLIFSVVCIEFFEILVICNIFLISHYVWDKKYVENVLNVEKISTQH